MNKKGFWMFMFLLGMLLIFSCRDDDDEIIPSVVTKVTPSDSVLGPVKGFFLLNEGNMGSNKASLDYFDYASGEYHKNIFPERNPNVVKELGDVGNDIQIYGSKLYAVINCSHLIEVMDVNTAKEISKITVTNCRYIVFKDGYAYVSSYAGPVLIDPNARLGEVVKIDTATLQVVGSCTVGYQPEEMVIVGNKLYVANSGGYRVPNYDNTVSVIDLETFEEIKKITVAINLHRMRVDRDGLIYVTSRGDYYDVHSNTYVINSKTDMVAGTLNFPASELYLCGDSLYSYSTEYSKITGKWTINYTIYDTKMRRVVSRSFIKDGTDKLIVTPYALAVNPENGEILVGDAGDYVTPGTLYCFTPRGKKKWSVQTGDIPAHIVFTTNSLQYDR
ncbi:MULTISPECIES: YncE family protein [Odoribacteraceae]|uniref:YncE family protein n=1 Tax=Odoribacteraceae TaxID=1853231 RepID=UPI00267C84BC